MSKEGTEPQANILGQNTEIQEQVLNRINKLTELSAQDKNPFWITEAKQTHHTQEILDNYANLEEKEVYIAGRIMAKRGMGKVSFVDLMDRQGRIQIFTKIDVLGEESYQNWQNLDIGDLIEVHGDVFTTKRGEISIRNQGYRLLSKCLRPLPEKFHGLQDTDIR